LKIFFKYLCMRLSYYCTMLIKYLTISVIKKCRIPYGTYSSKARPQILMKMRIVILGLISPLQYRKITIN
jgi:hypothetical protein